MIETFYSLLFSNRPVSISDSRNVFGVEAELWEEGLFMDSCLTNDNEQKCNEALMKWFEHPAKTKSLFFAEIAKKRDSIAPSKALIDDSMKRLRYRNQNVAELRFSGKTVIFVFTNPEIDEFCITNIFLPSGASIFNDLKGAEKRYYK